MNEETWWCKLRRISRTIIKTINSYNIPLNYNLDKYIFVLDIEIEALDIA